MIALGLTAAKQAQLNAALADHHSIYVTVQLLTTAGVRLADLSWRLLDGQVNIDASAAVTRSCTLSLLDPNRTLSFDSGSPDDGAIYMDRMVQVQYSVKSPALGDWVTIPLFTGPITKMDRTDDVVAIEAQGKEALALGAVWQPMTFQKGAPTVEAIRTIMSTRSGETKFSFADSTARLPDSYSLGRQSTAWGSARALAASLSMQLFYDGRGTCRLRPYPQASVFHFRTGDNGTVTSTPQISYSTENVKNAIWVKGGVPKGQKFGIESMAFAPSTHPLSPAKLGRNGVPRFLLETIENPSVMSTSFARAIAEVELRKALLEAVSVAFDAMPVPHLDPFDVCRLYSDQFSDAFRFSRASIPLIASDGNHMSVGYLSNVSMFKRRIRR